MSSLLFGFIGLPGHMELLIILVVFLLLFGHRLPSVMRNLGSSAREFKKGVTGMSEELADADEELKKVEKPKAKAKEASATEEAQ
jgi:sec-independent protein translocase protein TatA